MLDLAKSAAIVPIMKKHALFALAFSFALGLALGVSAIAKEKDEDSGNDVTVEKLTLVRDTGKDFQPVKKFKPTDIFGVLVQLSEAKEGTKVKGVWTAVDAGGMLEKKLFEKTLDLTAEVIKTVKNPSRVDFTLSHDNPYPTGDYKFEVFVNGELGDTLEFKIED